MAIPFSKYVAITSGVGGGSAVARKDLIGRLFTNNELVPPDTVLEFTELADVGIYFGTTSEEYKRASFYFGFISKNIVRAKKISFYRWVDVSTEPKVFGGTDTKAVGDFTSITDGSFDLTIGGVTHTITINFSTALNLSDVASLIQTQVQLETEPQFATATVTYNATRKSFDFVGGVAEDAEISVTSGSTGTNITELLQWNAFAIFSKGKLAETLTSCLDTSIDISTNFASFLFMHDLTLDEKEEVAMWNQAQNVAFMYCEKTTINGASTDSARLINYGGTSLTLGYGGEYQEMMPMILIASTDYSKRNSVQNFMFQQFDATPTVTTSTLSNTLDALRVNYYGQTQTAGQKINFYQRGNLMGGATDPISMNVYANEIWLKDAVGASIMSLLLSLAKVSANANGRAKILTTVQSVIEEALFNGVISVGKTFNNTQRIFIAEITGDDLAYLEVQNKGYWIDAVVQESVVNGVTEYSVDYTLVYGKDDIVRKVNGTHILI